jgi:hypothetical protein
MIDSVSKPVIRESTSVIGVLVDAFSPLIQRSAWKVVFYL